MTGVAQQTARNAGPLLASNAPDRLPPPLLLVLLLCWIAVILVILRLTDPRTPQRNVRHSRRSAASPSPPGPRSDDGRWFAPDVQPRAHQAVARAGWRVADRLHQVPVQIIAPSGASSRAAAFHDRTAADLLEDLAGPVLDAGQRGYRRSWGGVLLHGADEGQLSEVAAALAADHGVPVVVVRAHDIVPVDQRPVVAPVFTLAATMAPCVLLVECVDQLSDPTAPLVVTRHARRVEHELTTAIRSVAPVADVVVIASARSSDAVPPGLLQNGCLDRVIAVRTPNARQRSRLIRTELLRRRATLDGALDGVVRLSNGMTQHRIMDAVQQACRDARRRDPGPEPLAVSTIDLYAALRRPFGEDPLAIGSQREARIRDLVRLAQDPTASFSLVLAGDNGNGSADVAPWIADRARQTVAWLDAADLGLVPADELEQMVVAASAELPVVVVLEQLDLLLGHDDRSGRRKIALTAVERLARTSGAAVIATVRQPELIDPMLVEDGTLEVMWIPRPAFHDRGALLTHALGHAVLFDTTIEELAASLHGATRAQVVALCRAAVHAAALRDRTGRSSTLTVVRADFRLPPTGSD